MNEPIKSTPILKPSKEELDTIINFLEKEDPLIVWHLFKIHTWHSKSQEARSPIEKEIIDWAKLREAGVPCCK